MLAYGGNLVLESKTTELRTAWDKLVEIKDMIKFLEDSKARVQELEAVGCMHRSRLHSQINSIYSLSMPLAARCGSPISKMNAPRR